LTVPNPATNDILQRVVRELCYIFINLNINLITYQFIKKIVTGNKGSRNISRFISIEPIQRYLECFDWDTRASREDTGALHVCHIVKRLRPGAKEENFSHRLHHQGGIGCQIKFGIGHTSGAIPRTNTGISLKIGWCPTITKFAARLSPAHSDELQSGVATPTSPRNSG